MVFTGNSRPNTVPSGEFGLRYQPSSDYANAFDSGRHFSSSTARGLFTADANAIGPSPCVKTEWRRRKRTGDVRSAQARIQSRHRSAIPLRQRVGRQIIQYRSGCRR